MDKGWSYYMDTVNSAAIKHPSLHDGRQASSNWKSSARSCRTQLVNCDLPNLNDSPTGKPPDGD
jgi:hypothetical protein